MKWFTEHNDLRVMADARDYYLYTEKYRPIEAPWIVSKKAIMITAPEECEPFVQNESLVASGEQSFMQMILDGQLKRGAYFTITPCYRPADAARNDGLHLAQFTKLELIDFYENVEPTHEDLKRMIVGAKKFMEDARGEMLDIVRVPDSEHRECFTFENYDIMTAGPGEIELGSYGIRRHPDIGYWVYGTGAALPRLMHGV